MADGDQLSISKAIGRAVRLRRQALGLSQKQLAEPLGVAYQQIQKYEKGEDRISASALQIIANRLDVHPGYFFAAPRVPPLAGFAEPDQAA